MNDPLKAHQGADDEARIEHLLVTGLDHYFAGEFEHAINLWTRVLFLDRNHDRARAYIERARSAQAEQQRISEALVHQGLEAFDKGEVERARALLSDALDQGASHDVALGVLGRIDRLDAGKKTRQPAPASRRRASTNTSPVASQAGQRNSNIKWWITAAAGVAAIGVAFALVAPDGWGLFPERTSNAARPTIVAPPTILPVPSPTEAYVSQARALFTGGKLRDALRALDRVPIGDSLRPEAERLRADIQRELLAVAGAETASASSTPVPETRPRE